MMHSHLGVSYLKGPSQPRLPFSSSILSSSRCYLSLMNRICTIIATNYLPQAKALLESIRMIYPNTEFWVLITDGQTRDIPFLPTAKILLPEDLEIPGEWLTDMRTFYDQVELATSLKPFLLHTLLSEDTSTVTFLDPDILLFGELTEGFKAGEEFGIALTPHRLTPSNVLSPEFNELAFLQYGIFNLGYICVGQKAKPMIKWWEERLRWFCTRFPFDTVFTDQKWMNFVPALFEFKVIRNFGYDFAPWNYDERRLSIKDGVLFANETALIFVHFSQMSGILAAGGQTDLWKKSHSQSNQGIESFQIISKLTAEYSSNLVELRTEISGWAKEHTRPDISTLPSFHKRQKLIEESLNRERGLVDNKVLRLRPPSKIHATSGIIRAIERSSTLNGARIGFHEDSAKVTLRLRSFLKGILRLK